MHPTPVETLLEPLLVRLGHLSTVTLASVTLASCTVLLTPTATSASEPDKSSHEEEPRNLVSIGTRAAYHALRERNATVQGAPEGEALVGGLISYERVLVPEAWAFVVSKPFLFNAERFDSPFELQGKRLFAAGKWEFFASAGITFNIRFFNAKRREEESRSNELSFGVVASGGLTYRLGGRVKVGLELGYAWIPLSNVVEHELCASLVTGYAF